MARQSLQPIAFGNTVRVDHSAVMSSGRAGVVFPVAHVPLLRGDSASGVFGIDVLLAQMPKALYNAVQLNVQAWFVPKPAMPWFTSFEEFQHSYHGEPIKQMGAPDRQPPAFYQVIRDTALATYRSSTFLKTMGIHLPPNSLANSDLVDSFNLVHNFRLASHSSRLERRKYFAENPAESLELPPAFWPTNRFSRVVPDYERALVVGALDLDVTAGQVPIIGNSDVLLKAASRTAARWVQSNGNQLPNTSQRLISKNGVTNGQVQNGTGNDVDTPVVFDPKGSLELGLANIKADLSATIITTSLANVDKARIVQAFAQQRAAMAGNDYTGFDNENVLLAELMQGFTVPDTEQRRPWLLGQQRVTFGMEERHATDGQSLDKSVTDGTASVKLSINVPKNDYGGTIIFIAEVLPERIYERQADQSMVLTAPSQLPDALRDIQRPEPVDIVRNQRLDVAHTAGNATYGFEPMNDVWNREFTRLGGVFYKPAPSDEWTENRSAIWLPEMVDPTFTKSHFLAPVPFPHDVFSDTLGQAFEFTARHDFSIMGITQVGDVLVENNDDYKEIVA